MYLRPNPKKNMVYGLGPMPELTITITSSYVDPNAIMGNSMPESTSTLYQRGFIPQLGTLDFASDVHSVKWSNIYSPSKLPPQISLLLIKFYTKFPN